MVQGSLHGIARYALELAQRLPLLEPNWEFIGLTHPSGLPDNLFELKPRFPLVACPAPYLSPWEQPALAYSLSRLKPDLYHATSFSVPRFWSGPLAVTLHDANHLDLREEYGWTQAAYYKWIVAPRAKEALAIITISDFSREALARKLKLPSEKLKIVSQGVSERFQQASTTAISEFKRKFALPDAYLAVVGNAKRFKNLEVLGRIPTSLPLSLVALAGNGARARLGQWTQVFELPALQECDMTAFYSGATALLFPSRYEGFGLPCLEAMACRTPVIASSAGALPEVVGEAGLLVDPENELAWAKAIDALCHQSELRERLIEAGQAQVRRFSWETCARLTRDLFRHAMKLPPAAHAL